MTHCFSKRLAVNTMARVIGICSNGLLDLLNQFLILQYSIGALHVIRSTPILYTPQGLVTTNLSSKKIDHPMNTFNIVHVHLYFFSCVFKVLCS